MSLQSSMGQDMPRWAFGDSPARADKLLALVLGGHKTATCCALSFFEAGEEAMPEVGQRSIVLDGKGHPACIIETTHLTRCAFKDVGEDLAYEEGEGDRTLEYWRKAHQSYFERNGGFSPDMILVCERFKLVEVLPRTDKAS